MATTGGRSTIGSRGIGFVVVGAALVVVAILQLTWYAVDDGNDSAGNGFTFDDLRQNADQLSAPVASAYFDWLAWTLVIAVAVVGILANIPTPAANGLRVLGFLIGVAGVVGTYYSLAQLFNAQRVAGGSDHGVLHNANLGVWTAAVGFLSTAIGAGLGPRPPD